MPRRASDQNETKIPPRERILQVADELFYREGIHVSGVDTIIVKSGVAKTTLYRYFPSKDDLIVAYLFGRNQRFFMALAAVEIQYAKDPKAQLIGIFEWLEALLARPDCYGCPFLITMTEYPDLNHPAHQVAVAHKQQVRDRVTKLAKQVGVKHPDELGQQLLLLIDGAFVHRRLFGTGDTGLKTGAIALIEAQLR